MQAPTDNLYKFMAIAGLICFVFFYFDYNKRRDALQVEMNSQLMDAAIITAKIEIFSTKQSDLLREIENFKLKGEKLEDLIAIRKEWKGSQPGLDELILLQAKSKRGAEFVNESMEELGNLKRNYLIFEILSLLLCGVGMCLWYFKTQKYLDLKEAIVPVATTEKKLKNKLPVRK